MILEPLLVFVSICGLQTDHTDVLAKIVKRSIFAPLYFINYSSLKLPIIPGGN